MKGESPLKTPPAIEIYQCDVVATAPAAGSGASGPAQSAAVPPVASANPTLLVTIPSGVVSRYSDRGHVRYADPLTAEVFSARLRAACPVHGSHPCDPEESFSGFQCRRSARLSGRRPCL